MIRMQIRLLLSLSSQQDQAPSPSPSPSRVPFLLLPILPTLKSRPAARALMLTTSLLKAADFTWQISTSSSSPIS